MTTEAVVPVLHPRATLFTPPATSDGRRIGFMFSVTGLSLITVMGVFGLLMRLTQATVLGIPPNWFYRILTLHGTGMIAGTLMVMMGAHWYVVHGVLPLRIGRMLASYWLITAGALAVMVATLLGGFGAGWTFLPPLPFHPASQWQTWSEAVFFCGDLLVGAGFFIYCLDVLEQAVHRYGGLAGALGWRYLTGHQSQEEAPPPQVVAGVVCVIDGLLTYAVGAAILLALLGRTYDHTVAFNELVAKNLVYFFGHSIANLAIYIAAAVLYVILPRYAGRRYLSTKPFVAGWATSMAMIVLGYSHHLYMDFAQPTWLEGISEAATYGSGVPVAVITIYSMSMLVWGSRFRWTLASSLLYLGMAGWAIGGVGAMIDGMVPFNFRFHNTLWVIGHVHTYEMMGVVLWVLAFLAHLLERDAQRTSSLRARVLSITLMVIGGYGLTFTWFFEGMLGIPRRYAIQPPGTVTYSVIGASFALTFAFGFLLCLGQLALLARDGRQRRVALSALASVASPLLGREPSSALAFGALEPAPQSAPFQTRRQLGYAAAACVVALAAFAPQIVNASEVSVHWHHLDHAADFLFGVILALILGSLPRVSRLIGDHATSGLIAVIAAPTLMMLVMVPGVYGPLEAHPMLHALYHLGMAALGVITGLGASRLSRTAALSASFLSVAGALMFAAAVTGIP